MASPFPGMDPYLERHWRDVHGKLIVYACDQLSPQLPRPLYVRSEEYLVVEAGEDEARRYEPDVQVRERQSNGSAFPPIASATLAVTVAEPVIIPLPNESTTQRSVRIYDSASGNKLVTAIELLSPANKIGRFGRRQYRQKQRGFLEASVNLVEIDLVRVGSHVLAPPLLSMPPECRRPYRISVVRGGQDCAEVYRVSLRQRLPAIRIPLRQADPDAVLDLQPLLDHCYAVGRYEDGIDYREGPVPPLRGEDTAWVDELLRSKGKR